MTTVLVDRDAVRQRDAALAKAAKLRAALEMLLRSGWQGATAGQIARTNACIELEHPVKDENADEGPCLCGVRT